MRKKRPKSFRKEKILAFKAKITLHNRVPVPEEQRWECHSLLMGVPRNYTSCTQDHLRNGERFAISGEEVEFFGHGNRSHVGP